MALVTSVLLFCALLRWQLYGTRLHLPLWFLAGPLVGLTLFGRSHRVVIVAPLLLVARAPALFSKWLRPLYPVARSQPRSVLLTGRSSEMFNNVPQDLPAYEQAARAIKAAGVTAVGLNIRPGSFEYPLWHYLQRLNARVTIEHIGDVYAGRAFSVEAPLVAVVDYTKRFDGTFGPPAGYGLLLENGPIRLWRRLVTK